MGKNALIAALVGSIAASLATAAYSQRHRPHQESPPTQQQPAPEQRGTPQAPFVVQIQQAEQTKEEAKTGSEHRANQRDDSWFAGWNLSDRIAGIASAAALAQFLALIWTVFIMVTNGHRQLRAYVSPHDAAILDGSMLNPPQPPRFNVPGILLNFKNSGQTPAYKVVSWARIEIAETINEDRLVAPILEQKFTTTLGPGDVMPKALWYERPLTAGEIADIGSGARAIYLYGRIEYRDAFKRQRRANFRFRYNGAFPPPVGVILNHCERGNNAD